MPKTDDFRIDDASYAEGRAAFASGASLRSIAEQLQGAAAGSIDEDKVMCSTIGFFDALLDLLRNGASSR